MKKFFLIIALSVGGALPSPAQAPVDDNLRLEVEKILRLFEKKKYDEVIERAKVLELDDEVGAFVLNLQGAAQTKLKNYDAARAFFQKALEKSPGFFAANFNLGEILFLERKYADALAWFSGMLVNDPRNELLQFKVFLCHLLMENEEAARKSLSRMKFPGDTPAWYFASAAWELHRGNRGKAIDFIDGARFIFPGKTEIYEETFTDLGWPIR